MLVKCIQRMGQRSFCFCRRSVHFWWRYARKTIFTFFVPSLNLDLSILELHHHSLT